MPYLTTAGSARNNAKKRDKERRKKNGSVQKAKPSTPTQEIDARMGEEEKNRKQKEEQKKKTERTPNPATWTIWSPRMNRMDHTVGPTSPNEVENPGNRYRQRLGGQARPRPHSRYIHVKPE